MGKWMDDDAPGWAAGRALVRPVRGRAGERCVSELRPARTLRAELPAERRPERRPRRRSMQSMRTDRTLGERVLAAVRGRRGRGRVPRRRTAAAARGRAIGARGAEDSDTTRARARRRRWRRSREAREARRRRAITADAWDTSRGTADKAAAREGTITPERRSNARARVRTMCAIAAAKRDTGRARARNRTRERRPSARDKRRRTISATDAASSGTSPRIARCPRTTRAEFASKRDTFARECPNKDTAAAANMDADLDNYMKEGAEKKESGEA